MVMAEAADDEIIPAFFRQIHFYFFSPSQVKTVQDLSLKCSAWKGFINTSKKKFGSKKNFWYEKIFWSEKIWGQNFFWNQ